MKEMIVLFLLGIISGIFLTAIVYFGFKIYDWIKRVSNAVNDLDFKLSRYDKTFLTFDKRIKFCEELEHMKILGGNNIKENHEEDQEIS